MEVIDGDKTKCDRCEDILPLDDAVALEKEGTKAYLKILCEDCLKTVGVPTGYTLERNISYLKR